MPAAGSAKLEQAKSDRRSRFEGKAGGVKGFLAKHKGNVFLDVDEEGKQVLTHIKTLSRMYCPAEGGPWTLHFGADDDELGCLVGSQCPPKTVCLEDYLHRQLYTTNDGVEYVVVKQQGAVVGKWSLHDKLRDHSPITAEVQFDGTKELQLFLLAWPRDGCRMFWGLNTLHKAMNLHVEVGKPAKWAYSLTRGNHISLLEGYGMRSPLIKGNSSLKKEAALMSTTALFKDPSVCVCVLMCLFLLSFLGVSIVLLSCFYVLIVLVIVS